MTSSDEIQSTILRLIRDAGETGVRRPELRKAMDCRKGSAHEAFKAAFRQLMGDGRIVRKRGGRYALAEESGLLAGVISVNVSGGYGFVTLDSADGGAPDLFVPPKYLGDALTGDRVLVRVLETSERGTTVAVQKIVGRTARAVVGCLDDDGDSFYLRPMQRNLPERIPLACGEKDLAEVALGDWIQGRFLSPDRSGDGPVAEFVRRVGTGADLRGDLDAVVAEFGLSDPYGSDDERRAAARQPRDIQREDCRNLTVLTIDPEDAKDFDDGLSIETGPEPGRVTVGVHIADVAAFVSPGSDLDDGARLRGFTAYLPGRTLPMLPRILAAERCSLLAGRDSSAHSVFLVIDERTGEVLSARRAHTLVRVHERLTFGQVQDLFGEGIGRTAEHSPTLVALSALARVAVAMRAHRRRTEQFLQLAVPDVRVLCTEEPPRILGLRRIEPNRSHELVEEFMLAANSAVARELHGRRLPGIYRIHPPPKADGLEEFAYWAKFVMGTSLPALHEREQLNAFLARIADAPLADVIVNAFLRAMSRASYVAEAAEHFGLGKDLYLHFTSPIRRYPDLVVHQQLWALDSADAPRGLAECAEIAEQCTAREVVCDNAYYAACDRLKLRHIRTMEDQDPGACHDAVVAKVAAEGLLLYLPQFGMQGFLAASLFRGQQYRRAPDAMAMHADGSGKSYKCGDCMQVQVRRADPVRGELILQPVQMRVDWNRR